MSQKGFNRIEVLVLIAIIIIVVTLFLNFVFDIQKKVRDSKRKADIESIAKQLEVHFNRLTDQFCKDVNVDSYCHPQLSWFDKGNIPVDPLTKEPYINLPKDGDKKFMICAKLEIGGQYCQKSQQ